MRNTAVSLLLVLACLLAPNANAEISFLITVDAVENDSGADVPVETGSWVLLADTTRDGFGQIQSGPISTGALIGSADLVVARGDFTTFATPGIISANPTSLGFSDGWDEGDPLALVWFPDAGVSPSNLENGDAYGLYQSATGEGASDPWVTPADGSLNHNLQLLTTDGNGFFGAGTIDPAEVAADLTVGQSGPLDTDSDGMPDEWENANGLDFEDPSDAGLDGDDDCKTNLEEYLAGTDPNDPASRLEIVSIVDTAGDQSSFSLTWASVVNPEVTYTVSTSPDLTSWTNVITGIPASALTTQRDVAVAAGDALYLRVTASR